MSQDPTEFFAGTESLQIPVTQPPPNDLDPVYPNGWRWGDPGWRDVVGQDPSKIALEALRRAVDIRDQPDTSQLRSRPVVLVSVLNLLCEVLGVDGHDLWKTDA
ncbi:MAG TPA: hypothetical protein VGH31_02635 [Acidimicrobiales bacterium]